MAYAYSPAKWTTLLSPSETVKFLETDAEGSYSLHVVTTLWLTAQLAIAAAAGFTHAFFAWLVPFAAEEVLQQLATLVVAKRDVGLSALSSGLSSSLRSVDLSGTAVTDRGLSALAWSHALAISIWRVISRSISRVETAF